MNSEGGSGRRRSRGRPQITRGETRARDVRRGFARDLHQWCLRGAVPSGSRTGRVPTPQGTDGLRHRGGRPERLLGGRRQRHPARVRPLQRARVRRRGRALAQRGDIGGLLRELDAPLASYQSLFDSEHKYEPWLHEAFDAIGASPLAADVAEDPSATEELDLFVTGTDFYGRKWATVDDRGSVVQGERPPRGVLAQAPQRSQRAVRARRGSLGPAAGSGAIDYPRGARAARAHHLLLSRRVRARDRRGGRAARRPSAALGCHSTLQWRAGFHRRRRARQQAVFQHHRRHLLAAHRAARLALAALRRAGSRALRARRPGAGDTETWSGRRSRR